MATSNRLRRDISSLFKSPPPDVIIPVDSADVGLDDLSTISIYLFGPEGTAYSEGAWKLTLKIPRDYPSSPPKAYFNTKIFHPNVEPSTGEVCVDTLKRDWTSDVDLCKILLVS
jgi:ubiquitin-conjugating enzyme E2 S